MRLSIRNRLILLAIRDNSELVKRALFVEQDIKDTNQIQEQRGDRKRETKSGGKFLEEILELVAEAKRLII